MSNYELYMLEFYVLLRFSKVCLKPFIKFKVHVLIWIAVVAKMHAYLLRTGFTIIQSI